MHRAAGIGSVEVTIDLGDFAAAPEADVMTLAGESIIDQNTQDHPRRIVPQPSTLAVEGRQARITAAPFSMMRIRFAAVS